METRAQRVSQGGLFHSHKVKYSKETQDLLHSLIEESKLSILQRQKLKESIKKGEPLPYPECRNQNETVLRKSEVLVPPAPLRRRSYQAIIKSGAYQRELFDPPFYNNMKDRNVEKQKLQSLMTYGKDVSPDQLDFKQRIRLKHKWEEEQTDSEALFDHLIDEVRDRLQFLKEMESLGQAKPYQTVIEQEVAAKLRQMEKIDQKRLNQIRLDWDKEGLANLKSDRPIKDQNIFNNI